MPGNSGRKLNSEAIKKKIVVGEVIILQNFSFLFYRIFKRYISN